MHYTFDELEGTDSYSQKPEKPFSFINTKDEQELLKWLNTNVNFVKKVNEDRFREIKKYRALYEGIQYRSQGVRSRSSEVSDTPMKKVVINHVFDIVANKVSKVLKFKNAIAVLPNNDEASDKIGAKSCESLVNHVWNKENFNGEKCPKIAKSSFVDGESFLHIFWNPNDGHVHPDQINAEKVGKKLELYGEDDKPVKDKDGKPVYIDKKVKVGDVAYETVLTTDLLFQPNASMKYEECDFVFRQRVGNVHELKRDYEDKSHKISAIENSTSYNVDNSDKQKIVNPRSEVVYYEFYHRKTEDVPDGFYCKFMQSTVLEDKKFPYDHGELPFIRYTDIDFLNNIHGTSFLVNLKGPSAVYNNLTNMVIRNQYLASHPKWLIPSGSVNKQDLGNDLTLVQYKGPIEPKLIQQNPTPAEVFNFIEKTKENMVQVAGLSGVSRGEPPKGIEAGVALEFLSEQETERFNETILKWSEWVRQVAIMTMKLCKQYYKAGDKRTIAVLGRDHAWSTDIFDPKVLDFDYDVKVQSTSALPQSKAGRMSLLMKLKKDHPDLISNDRFLDLMEFSQNEKFVDLATQSVKCAEMENEILLSRGTIGEPEDFEDHILHWEVHVQLLRSFAIKSYGKKVIDKLKDHILATEFLMVEKSADNPAYAQQLQGLSAFPLLYVPDPPPPPPPPVEELPPEAAPDVIPPEGEVPLEPALPQQPNNLINDPLEQQQLVNP